MKFFRVSSFVLTMVLAIGMLSSALAEDFTLVSEYLGTGNYSNGVVSNNRLYVATEHGFQIFDVSATTPALLGEVHTDGVAVDVALNSNFLYVADGYNGLLSYIVSNPSNPALAFHLEGFNGPVNAVWFDNAKLYVAMGSAGVAMVDLTNPTNPTILDQEDTPGRALDCSVYDGYLYVSDYSSIRSFNTTGNELTAASSIDPTADHYYGILTDGGVLYAANGGNGVERIDLTGGGNMSSIGSTVTTFALQVADFGNYYAIALDHNGIMVMDNTGAAHGIFTGVSNNTVGVATEGFNIFSLEGDFGFEVVDGSVPGSMSVSGSYEKFGGPRNIWVDGNYAYVASHSGGFVVVDVTDPSTPNTVATLDLGTWVYDVVVVGNYAYACEFFSGVYCIDISTPSNPTIVTSYQITDAGSRALSFGTNYLVLVHYTNGVYKFDISTPNTITLLGSATTNGEPRDVVVDASSNLAYVADYNGGADIWDVSGTGNPTLTGEYTMNRCRAVAYLNNYLYAGSEEGNMDIIDVSTPANPTLVSSYTSIGAINGLAVATEDNITVAYVCAWENGLEAVNVTSAAHPGQWETYDTHALAKACFVTSDNERLYVADSYAMYIFGINVKVEQLPEHGVPAAFELSQNFPNPFNPETSMLLSLPTSGNVTLAVYDVQGREVGRLVDGFKEAGSYQVTFNASSLASGVYYAKLSANGASQVTKMLLIK